MSEPSRVVMPSGVGELVCEVSCDAVGEGYARSGRDRTRRAIVFSGSGELAGELRGLDRRLAGGEDRSESERAKSIVAASDSARGQVHRAMIAGAVAIIHATIALQNCLPATMIRVVGGSGVWTCGSNGHWEGNAM